MIIEAFEVECFARRAARLRDEHRLRLLPEEAFENQVGLPATDEERARIDRAVASRDRPRARGPRATSTAPRGCPAPMLLMLDRVTGY